ncbi:MAG: efflux RND transporter permease subunit, partial [Polyangiaceae bacterium]|nr:efflux RND transporter permease subunit [Polyangiaceae bacterium]
MNISEPFIKRPVATTLLTITLVLIGVLAYPLLPVSPLPNVDFPTINVSASLPGASPETMAASVATPLEKEFSSIDGVDSMTSTSTLGSTQITLQFNLARDLDAAAQDVQSAMSRASRLLPRDMPTQPSFRKVNPAEAPIIQIALGSDTLPLYKVNEYAETILAQRLSTLLGVAQVQVYGSQKYAVRIQVDPLKLKARGVGIDEVASAIQRANSHLPTGTMYGPDKAYVIQTNGQLNNADEYKPVVVSYVNGAPVRVEDIAKVYDGVENDKAAAWFGDSRSIILAVQKQPGANTVAVAKAIRDSLPAFQADLPAAVNLSILFDRSESVRESIEDVQLTLGLTLVLVVAVIFLFLRNVRSTIVPALAMPLSIVGTFAVMYALGYSLNNLSLMALTLSVGFVVDDAIVMLENVVRHMEMGKSRMQAALDGSKEIAFTIVSMTISLAAVFIPILLMSGIVGQLFREFAVTIAASILISGVVSLTLSPMMASRLLESESSQKHGAAYAAIERAFDAVLGVYSRSLRFVLRHRFSTMVFSALVLAATVLLYVQIPKGFLPTEDTGQISAMTEAAEGISFESMVEHQQKVAAVLAKSPHVDAFMSSAGARGSMGSNSGTVFIRLKPRSERDLGAAEIIEELRPQLAQIPGIRVFLQIPPTIRIGGRMTKSEYQLSLQGTDTAALYKSVPTFEEAMKKIPGIRDVTTDLQLKNAQISLDIDRDRAASLGIGIDQIESALFSAYGARQVTTIYSPNSTNVVILEVDPA